MYKLLKWHKHCGTSNKSKYIEGKNDLSKLLDVQKPTSGQLHLVSVAPKVPPSLPGVNWTINLS